MVSKSNLTIVGILELGIEGCRRREVVMGIIVINKHELLFSGIRTQPFKRKIRGFLALTLSTRS